MMLGEDMTPPADGALVFEPLEIDSLGGGLPELLDELASRIAASVQIPAEYLMVGGEWFLDPDVGSPLAGRP